MKSYTDLSQSKKLAEILPLESADMFWRYNHNIHTYDDIPKILVVNNWDDDYNKDIPCWSLTALLDILNKSAYFINENGIAEISSFKSVRWSASILNCGKIEDCYADNPVDACYGMIIELHEQNIL